MKTTVHFKEAIEIDDLRRHYITSEDEGVVEIDGDDGGIQIETETAYYYIPYSNVRVAVKRKD